MTYYEPRNLPQDFQRSKASLVSGELNRIKDAFGGIPPQNDLVGGVFLLAEESTTSVANTYVLVSEYPITSLKKGVTVRCVFVNSNTGPSTVNVDVTGTKDIRLVDGSALEQGAIHAGRPHDLFYDGNRFLLLNPASGALSSIFFSEIVLRRSFRINEKITAFTLPDAGGGSSPYTYSVTGLPSGLAFDDTDREVTGTPDVLGESTVTYTATDSNTATYSIQFKIQIVASVLTLGTETDRSITQGVSYEYTLGAASGGNSPYTYSVSGIPPGMIFDAVNRRLYGTPNRPGLFRVSYGVTDSGTPSQTESTQFDITVAADTSLSIPNLLPRSAVPNQPIGTFTLPDGQGGVLPYTRIILGLPPGLTFDEDSRQVTGTPEQAGKFTVTYRIQDNQGTHVDATFDYTVASPGRRYVFVVDTPTEDISASEIQSGVDFGADSTELATPEYTGNKVICVAQRQSQDDLTYISFGTFGNNISDFHKKIYTRSIESIDHEIWATNRAQGTVYSEHQLTVR